MPGMKVGELFFDIVGKTGMLFADLDKVKAKATAVGQKLGAIGRTLTLGVTTPLVGVGVAMVKFASDAAEAANKVDVVFGEQAAAIQSWAQTSASAIGIARSEALEAAGTFGNLFTTMGLGQQTSATMSMSIVELAADLASFNNIDPSIALEKLRAGLVGEAEPLRALGVNLTEAEVKAQAMAMGLADANGEVDTAAKVQARYALILEQTTNAQGDFERTSDGLANQQRILSATLKDLGAAFGEFIIPHVQAAAAALLPYLEQLKTLPPETQKVILVAGGLAAALGPVLMIVGQIAMALPALSGALAALVSPIGLVVAAVGGLVAAWVYMYRENETARVIIQSVWAALLPFLTNAFNQIKAGVLLVAALLRGDWAEAWTQAKALVMASLAQIAQGARTWVSVMAGIWGNMASSAIGWARSLVSGVRDYFRKLGSDAATSVYAMRDAITGGFIAAYKSATDWAANMAAAVKDVFASGLRAAGDAVKRALDRITGFFRRQHQKVVGNSIVPDMIREIQAWMERLSGPAMVDPVENATARVVQVLGGLADGLRVSAFWAGVTGDEWGAMAEEARLLENAISSLISQGYAPESVEVQRLLEQYRVLTSSVEGHAAAVAAATEAEERETAALTAGISAQREKIAVIEAETRAKEELARVRDEAAREREREALIARWAAEQEEANRPPGVVTESEIDEGRRLLRIRERVLREQEAARLAQPPPLVVDLLNTQGELETLETTVIGVAEAARKNDRDWKGWLGDARRWMQLLGVETDTFAGKLLNAAQAFFDFGGGIGGIAGGLASLLGIDLGGVVNSVGRWVRNALGDIGDFLGLADGGTITMPGTVLVGERGPELLTLPRGAQVTPLDRAGAGGTIVVPVYLDGREIARATLPHQAREMQLRGVTS